MTVTEIGLYLALLAVGYGWLRFNRAWLDDAFSPINLLFVFWVLPYLLSLLKLSEFQRGLSIEAHAIVIAATLALLAPSLLAIWALRRSPLSHSLSRFAASHLRSQSGLLLVLIFLAVTVAAYYLSVFAGRGTPITQYLGGGATRADLHQAGMESRLQILAAAVHVAGTMVLYSALTTSRRGAKIALLGVAAIPPIFGILRVFKTDVFISLLYYSAMWYYYRRSQGRSLPVGKTLLVGFALVALLALMTTLRTTGGADNPTFYSTLIAFRYRDLLFPLNEIAGVVYGYGALPFENFGRFVEFGEHHLRIGTSMFRPFFSILMQGNIVDGMLEGIDWHYVAPFANAPNFLTQLYAEGGAWLCVIASLWYSVLINALYVHFRRSRSLVWLIVYINFLYPWTWIFFANAFSVLGYYVNALYVLMIALVAHQLDRVGRVGVVPSIGRA